MAIVLLNAGLDRNGNGRRAFVQFSEYGQIIGAWADEAGSSSIPSWLRVEYGNVEIEVAPKEFKRMVARGVAALSVTGRKPECIHGDIYELTVSTELDHDGAPIVVYRAGAGPMQAWETLDHAARFARKCGYTTVRLTRDGITVDLPTNEHVLNR